jgi:hypothetical protein
MVYHDDVVSRQMYVELDGIRAGDQCRLKARQGVFRVRPGRPAVRNDLWANGSRGRHMLRWRKAAHAAKVEVPSRRRNRESPAATTTTVLNQGQQDVINKWQ